MARESSSVLVADETAPTVTTYILKMKRQGEDRDRTIDLVRKITANGSVKRTHLWQNCTRCLDIRLMKDEETVLEAQRLSDPLVEEIEYLDEQGALQWTTIKPEEKIVAVRTNVRDEVAMLQFRFSDDSARKWITVKL